MIAPSPARDWLIARVPPRHRVRARYWYRAVRGKLDRELHVLRSLLPAGTVGIDVGAHHGMYSYFFSRAGLVVHAFEPLPVHAALLRTGLPGVVVHRVALGAEPAQAELVVPVEDGRPVASHAQVAGRRAAGAYSYKVEVRTLDSFELRNVSICKIDVEGNELPVLTGATALLARERPLLLLELEVRHVGNHGMNETIAWLRDLGYEGYFVGADNVIRAIDDFDAAVHQRLLRGAPDDQYVNNFLFAAAEQPLNTRLSSMARLRVAPAPG